MSSLEKVPAVESTDTRRKSDRRLGTSVDLLAGAICADLQVAVGRRGSVDANNSMEPTKRASADGVAA